MKHLLIRDLKQQYSWLPKGYGSQIFNILASNSWSLISALGSDGNFLNMIVPWSVDSSIFCKFLRILNNSISKNKDFQKNKIVWILDNASIHQSVNTHNVMNQIGITTMFLPPYTPTLAPVELYFRYLKTKIRSAKFSGKAVYGSKSGNQLIFKAWSEIDRKNLSQSWIHVIKECRRLLIMKNASNTK